MARASKWIKVCKLITVKTSKLSMDKVKKKLDERLNHKLVLGVGFFADATYPNGDKVADVARKNERGGINRPPRPFFRTAIMENSSTWLELIRTQQVKTKDMHKTLEVIGTIASGDISASIIDFSSPPNAPATIIAKNGKSNPLVDTGLMSRSVTYEISTKG